MCSGTGYVYRNIGHPGRAARFACECMRDRSSVIPASVRELPEADTTGKVTVK